MQATQIMIKMFGMTRYRKKAFKKGRKMKSEKYRKSQTSIVNTKI